MRNGQHQQLLRSMKLGTRGSDLALWQARLVRALLQEKAGADSELVIIRTQGDKDQVAAFDKMEGKGFFTKEIETALLNGTIDLAVHSLKDLQTEMPDGLRLGAIPQRADRRDMLLMRTPAFDVSQVLCLRRGSRIGTASARRVAQLRFLRPDLEIVPLRGNVPTRVRRLREGAFDAILVAAAGIDRLQIPLDGLLARRLPEAQFVPAPGQGALAVQIRDNDPDIAAAVALLHQPDVDDAVWLEREILRRLEGGCQLPLGTCADRTASGFRLSVFLGSEAPGQPVRFVVSGSDRDRVAEAAMTFLGSGANRKALPSKRPRVWITREPVRAAAFREALDPARLDTIALPVFCAVKGGDPRQQATAMSRIGSYAWVFFTSQVTVMLFADLLKAHDVSLGPKTRVAAIGRKTAEAVRRQGWHVGFVSDVADAVSLGEAFSQYIKGLDDDNHDAAGTILFPCSAKASHDLEITIARYRFELERLVCYDTEENPELATTVKPLPDPDVVVFTSPSAAGFLLERRPLAPGTTVLSIGPATTEALLKHGFPIVWEAADRSLEGLAEVTNGLVAL